MRDVFSKLGKEFKGSGGGHQAAAAFNGQAKDIKSVLDRCVHLSHDSLKMIFKNKKSGLKKY